MALSDAVPFAVAAWTLDEASGSRVDQVGANDLTDNNTVLSATGLLGDAADFESANSESLSIADNAALSFGDTNWCISLWIKPESQILAQVLSKGDAGSNGFIIQLRGDISGPPRIIVVGGSQSILSATNHGALSNGVWYLIVIWHDATNNQIGISVNGVANTAAHTTGVTDNSDAFILGAGVSGSQYYDGLMDDVVVLKGYILDATEITELYNSGTGVAFADWAGGGAFTMPADPGSYAITGTVASLEQGYVIGADSGSFSISGVAANLNQGYEVAAVPGEYLLSGVNANFLLGFGFSADAGSYSITGTATTLLVANLLNAEVGSYLVSGVAANLEQGYLLQVGNPTSGSSFGTGSNDSAVGTHAWMGPENVDMDDGVSATASAVFSVLNTQYLKVLDFSTLSIPPDASIVGLTVTVDREPPGGANPTEFLKIVKGGIVVGNEVSGVMGSGIVILGDSESLSGFGVSLIPADIDENFGIVYRVTAGSAVNSASVDYIQVTIYYRDNAGVYSVTGTDPNFIEGFGLSADVGSYLITGVSANLLQHSVLNAAVGSYVITGVAVTLSENLENIVGGRFIAGQVYYPGFVNAEMFYPGFKQAQVNN